MGIPVVYLAHATEDKAALAEPLAHALMERGIDVWYDEWEIRAGDSLMAKMEAGLRDCTHFLAVLTPKSIQKNWVQAEIQAGFGGLLGEANRFIGVRSGVKVNELSPFLQTRLCPEIDVGDVASIDRLAEDILDVSRKPKLGGRPLSAAEPGDLTVDVLALQRASKPSERTRRLLTESCDDTAQDFAAQAAAFIGALDRRDGDRLRQAATGFCAMGYALVGADGELVEIDDPRATAERAGIGMHEYADEGWPLFTVLNVPERAPQRRESPLLGAYVEGMRLLSSGLVAGTVDYWRIYEAGVAATAISYKEDALAMSCSLPPRHLTTMQSVFRLHSLLAHARIVGQQTPDAKHVLVRLDWRDLQGRPLLVRPSDRFCDGVPVDPKFSKTIALPWADLRDRYFEALRRIIVPVFGVFPAGNSGRVDARVTKSFVEGELARFDRRTLRLFED